MMDEFAVWLHGLTHDQMRGSRSEPQSLRELSLYAPVSSSRPGHWKQPSRRVMQDRVLAALERISRNWTYLLQVDYIQRGDLLGEIAYSPAFRKELKARGLQRALDHLIAYDRRHGISPCHAPHPGWRYASKA